MNDNDTDADQAEDRRLFAERVKEAREAIDKVMPDECPYKFVLIIRDTDTPLELIETHSNAHDLIERVLMIGKGLQVEAEEEAEIEYGLSLSGGTP